MVTRPRGRRKAWAILAIALVLLASLGAWFAFGGRGPKGLTRVEDLNGVTEVRLARYAYDDEPQRKTVTITDPAKIAELVAAVNLTQKRRCACSHHETAVFIKGATQYKAWVCDHCFVTEGGRYAMPKEFYRLFRSYFPPDENELAAVSPAPVRPIGDWPRAAEFTGVVEIRLERRVGERDKRRDEAVTIADPAQIAELVRAIRLESKEPCRCHHSEFAVFARHDGMIKVWICDHCFDTDDGHYAMPAEFRRLFRRHLDEAVEGEPKAGAALPRVEEKR